MHVYLSFPLLEEPSLPFFFFLTLCEATLPGVQIEKNGILQERLLSEKRSSFVYYNLTLSESICVTDHEKQIQKFVEH